MNQDSRTKLKQLLVRHEAYKQFPYVDTTGHLTVGIGRNLSSRGISTTEAFYLLDEDILYFTGKLNVILPWYNDLDETRQIALIDMCFNLGVNGVLEFVHFLRALEDKDYTIASQELLASKAAIQCPERYHNLAQIILTGEL